MTQPERIRSFHQFYLSLEEHNQKSRKFARTKSEDHRMKLKKSHLI